MTASPDQTAAGGKAGSGAGKPAGDGARQTFRSPTAIIVWWVWAAFAVANLIDLAVQGRDRVSLVAAVILLLVTGVVYATAQRPRIVADSTGLRIVNPLRDHRIGWASVARVDATDLVRVRCEWSRDEAGADGEDGQRVIYAWAVHSARRRQYAAQLRAERASRGRRVPPLLGGPGDRSAGPGAPAGGFGAPAGGSRAARLEPSEAEKTVAALTAYAEQARSSHPKAQAGRPVSTWYWPTFAAIVVPALALLIVILA